jgi:hypothetical protein
MTLDEKISQMMDIADSIRASESHPITGGTKDYTELPGPVLPQFFPRPSVYQLPLMIA